jgi:hypothetical protein
VLTDLGLIILFVVATETIPAPPEGGAALGRALQSSRRGGLNPRFHPRAA